MKKIILITALLTCMVTAPSALAQNQELLVVKQEVRNLTKQSFAWGTVAQAEPGDRLEFRVSITWKGSLATTNVLVNEMLGGGLTYMGNLKLDGVPSNGSVTTQNFNTGTYGENQTKVITFEAMVNSADTFLAGSTDVINTSTVFNSQGADSTTTKIQVVRDGSPTDVSTGPLSMKTIALAFVFLLAVLAGGALLVRYYISHRILQSEYETRYERRFAETINKIQKKEKRGA